MSKFEVLCATMHQSDFSKIQQMNIQSDVIFANQSDRTCMESMEFGNYHARMITTDTRGVGINRNLALLYAQGDICLFADDDVIYADGYMQTILDEFERHPKSDVIVFNVPSTNKDPRQKDYIAKRWKRLNILNCFRHGTFRIAVRRNQIMKNNIYFTSLFGGGARYSAGEDSLFLADCIRSGLRIYESNRTIGNVTHMESTWFRGYTDKYFRDKGAFYACFSKRIPFLWCLQFAIRRRKLYCAEKSFFEACRLMYQGIQEFRTYRQ